MKKLFEKVFTNSVILRCQRHSPIRCWYNFKASLQVAKNLKSAPSLTLSRGEGRGFTLAEVFSPCRKAKLSFGFTLAETLITLGIIGVVAAIVMPGVINDFKVKQLKAQFETADSIITQAMLHTAREFGYEKPTDFNLNLKTYEHYPNQKYASYVNEINEVWMKQFKGAKPLKWTYGDIVKTKDHYILSEETLYGYFWENGYLLPNGMFITPITLGPWGYLIFKFDTNGPLKGPNCYGHDLFIYTSTPFRYGCNAVYGDSYKNDGCYWYAHNKVNPNPKVDKSKDYWDILFKPRSYWE